MSRRTKKVKIVGRFGPRYGVKIRRTLQDYLSRAAATYACPKCERQRVRRVFSGVWRCRHCGHEFTGGAYQPEVSAK